MVDYGRQIAKAGLEIGAIQLRPEQPFLWASGYHMPIYNDNRKFLGYPEHRKMIAEGFGQMMQERSIFPDLIAGTSTSGIAPAASLAYLLGRPLVIKRGDDAFVFSDDYLSRPVVWKSAEGINLIASTCPFGIPPAVNEADRYGLPFAYVRSEKKDHGHKQKVEGVVRPGQTVRLIDEYMGESYNEIAVAELQNLGASVVQRTIRNVDSWLFPTSVSGKRILQIEDLISTGGSYLEEIAFFREQGAIVDDCFAIFSYDLDVARERAENAGVRISAQLYYPTLLEEAVASGSITAEGQAVLAEWRPDPFNWGERHGFPPKPKNK
ncbi:hypothetical protein KY363_04975 [Candidatus Woesearchaeota archaeon]|nr:hypothetical protein [Candidatus Woesearchaeota archaeon]